MTPNLFWISPISASSQQYVKWYGIYRTANTADIKKMHIGDQLCHRFDQDGATVLNDNEAIGPNDNTLVTCKVADDQEGGLFNVTLRSTAGNPRQLDSLTEYTSDGKTPFQFRVVPKITSVSSNAGSLKGQDLEIKGFGFSSDKSTVNVDAGGRTCAVTSATSTLIQCRVQDGPTTTFDPATSAGQFVSGTGITFQRFNLANTGLSNSDVLRTKYLAGASYFDDKILQNGKLSELEVL